MARGLKNMKNLMKGGSMDSVNVPMPLIVIGVIGVIGMAMMMRNNAVKRVKFNMKDNTVHNYSVEDSKQEKSNTANTKNNKNTKNNNGIDETGFREGNLEPNEKKLSYREYIDALERGYIINPNLPVERQHPDTYNIPINVQTRGPTGYQQIGVLLKEGVSDESSPISSNKPTILPLYGKPTYQGSNMWSYYTATDKFNQIKLPMTINGRKCNERYGCKEIMDGDIIPIPSYNGLFKATIYEYDSPKYIPHIW